MILKILAIALLLLSCSKKSPTIQSSSNPKNIVQHETRKKNQLENLVQTENELNFYLEKWEKKMAVFLSNNSALLEKYKGIKLANLKAKVKLFKAKSLTPNAIAKINSESQVQLLNLFGETLYLEYINRLKTENLENAKQGFRIPIQM